MTIHGTAPGPGGWPPWGTVRAALPGPCRGAESTVAPVGRELRFDRVTGGAGFPGGVDFLGSGFDRRTGGAGVARSASVRGPAIPLTGKPCARWNRRTARSVSAP